MCSSALSLLAQMVSTSRLAFSLLDLFLLLLSYWPPSFFTEDFTATPVSSFLRFHYIMNCKTVAAVNTQYYTSSVLNLPDQVGNLV